MFAVQIFRGNVSAFEGRAAAFWASRALCETQRIRISVLGASVVEVRGAQAFLDSCFSTTSAAKFSRFSAVAAILFTVDVMLLKFLKLSRR